jgi:biopolymer transport protein ExbB
MAFSLATILLQAASVTVDSTALMADSIVNSTPVQEVTKVVVEEFSVLDLLGKGGYVMYPIGFLFAAAVFLFIERYLYIRKTAKLDENFLHTIHDMLQAGNVQGAINFCKATSYPIAKLLE